MEPNVVEVEDEIGSPGAEPGRNGLVNRWAPSQFRRNMLGAALLIVIVTLALVVYYHNRISTDDAQIDGHITPMASKVYGNVLEVLVDDNQPVKAGQVLVRLDPRDYQAKVDQTHAALALGLTTASGQRFACTGISWSCLVDLTERREIGLARAASGARSQIIELDNDVGREIHPDVGVAAALNVLDRYLADTGGKAFRFRARERRGGAEIASSLRPLVLPVSAPVELGQGQAPGGGRGS